MIPDTRPGIRLDGFGVCSACRSHEKKFSSIDWGDRRRKFEGIVASTKALGRRYDCVIPVSGGKDSTWQVVKCLEYGLHPLAVTWKPPARTAIGAANLSNLIGLGIDHIDFSINPEVERKFLYRALERYGSTAIPMHMAMFNLPPLFAAKLDVPLVVWGENAADEYAGESDGVHGHQLDSGWLRKYGVTHGTTAADWVSAELTARELAPYFGPTDEDLVSRGIRAVFLGYYFNWDPKTSLQVARAHGFTARPEGPKTGYYDYADIDDDFISIHHFLKWYKFGFTRSYDNLALEIRNGRMSRDEAIRWLRERGDETPHADIEKFCQFVGINVVDFFQIIERFRNPKIWTRIGEKWLIQGFLIPDWNWT